MSSTRTDAIGISHIITLTTIYVVLVPLICYYTFKFWCNKTNPVIICRNPVFVLSLQILIVFGLISVTQSIVIEIWTFSYAMWIRNLMLSITTWGIINLLTLKSYLLFFRQRYQTAMKNSVWAKEINNNWNDWYIQNKKKWGSFRYVIKWLIIPYIIECIIHTLGEDILGWTVLTIFYFFAATIPLCLLLIFIIRLGKFYDVYGIRKEILGECLMLVVAIIIFFVAVTVARSYSNNDKQFFDTQHVIGDLVMVLLFFGIAMSSVCYSLHLIDKESNNTNQKQDNNTDISSQLLIKSFEDYTIFTQFMSHLTKEFCAENLLFIVECCQVKHNYQVSQDNVIVISPSATGTTRQNKDNNALIVIDFNGIIVPDIPRTPSIKFSDITEAIPDFSLASPSTPTSKEQIESSSPLSTNSPRVKKSLNKKHKIGVSTFFVNGNVIHDNITRIEFSSDIPVSNLLELYPDNINQQIKALNDKYISIEALHQINIPYKTRHRIELFIQKLDNDCENINIIDGDLFCLMDEACLNIIRLLLGPFKRYRESEQYLQYISNREMLDMHIKINKNKNKPKIYTLDQKL